MTLRIDHGQVLHPEGLRSTTVHIEHGRIARGPARAAHVLDAAGLWVLPGIVDLHGDAFERQMQPRPGVAFPAGLALRDTEAQLLANGITTAFHALTLSWEPGLRSPQAWTATLDALAAGAWTADMRVHMRWELHNLDALDLALADIARGRVHLLSFNDHTPSILRKLGTASGAAKYSERAGLEVHAFRALAKAALAHKPEVPAATTRIAAAARAAGLPMASHDDDTPAARLHYRGLGAAVCEFPMTEPVALAARAADEAVVMGCPNVVRGGSHLGWTSAAALAERGLCTILCSDYYYPSMAAAAWRLAQGPLGLPAAWALVSANPARAANLHDRGQIAEGTRADITLMEPATGAVVATIAGGRLAYVAASASFRCNPASAAA